MLFKQVPLTRQIQVLLFGNFWNFSPEYVQNAEPMASHITKTEPGLS